MKHLITVQYQELTGGWKNKLETYDLDKAEQVAQQLKQEQHEGEIYRIIAIRIVEVQLKTLNRIL